MSKQHSTFLTTRWYICLIAILILITFVIILIKIPKIKYQLDKLKVRMPGLGYLVCIIYTARFARNMSSLRSEERRVGKEC